MLRFCVLLAMGLTLSACVTGPAETLQSANAAEGCRTTREPGGGSSVDCTLWERITTTTTTTGPDGESRTTVERTQTGGDA